MAVYDLQLCTNSHKYALENIIDQEKPVVIYSHQYNTYVAETPTMQQPLQKCLWIFCDN